MSGNFSERLQTNYALSTALYGDQRNKITFYHNLPRSAQLSTCMLHIALVKGTKFTVDTSLCTLHQVLSEYSSGPACSVERQTMSLSTNIFPHQFKNCSVHLHLKKSNLEDDLSNYRPISHLSFLSKRTERIVKLRLADNLSTNDLLNSFQSAYNKHHSTETTLLSVHGHIMKAVSHQKVTLLDLSAAFDTIDPSILLERLSSCLAFLLLLSLTSNLIY